MKVLLISSSDTDGGAARATYRLHQGLQNQKIASQFLVQQKFSTDKSVLAPQISLSQGIAKAKLSFEKIPVKIFHKKYHSPFSIQWLPDRVVSKVKLLSPDVINLHWVNAGFLQIETLAQLKCPVVWTLHDMWPFTGGCHYSGDCENYRQKCGTCPQLDSLNSNDLSRWVWQRKARAWKKTQLTIVTPSQWLAECAKLSSLFKHNRIECIPNGIDTSRYRPLNQEFARQVLGLPQGKRLILTGAFTGSSDPRKGFHFLGSALLELSAAGWGEQLELVQFGSSHSQENSKVGLKTHNVGHLSDDYSLALLYAACDVFVAPSIQDNLPNTVMESLACGTPCIAFNLGGMPDLIEHQRNGYLARPFDIQDLTYGITWVLENSARFQSLRCYSRQKVENEFSLDLQANRYTALYEEVIQNYHRDLNPT